MQPQRGMMSSRVLLLLFCLQLATQVSCSVPNGAVAMKKYTVDLSLPPEKRWIPLLSVYKSSAPLMVQYFDQEVPKEARVLLDKLMGDLDGYLGELGKEMKAIADYLEIDLGIIVALNFAYELRKFGGGHPNTTGNITNPSHYEQPFKSGMACTSIVAQDPTGNIFHGRNLDWDLPDETRNLTVQVDFVKSGQLLFTGDVTVGFVGILTGMSRGGFSISVNERSLGGDPVVDALEALLRHAWSPTHLVRQVLTTATSYEEAIKLLQKSPLTAPVYFIAAGSQANQGAVVTRDRNLGVLKRSFLDLNVSVEERPNSWYLLETNYDHWKQPEPYDNRRFYGDLYMESVGQKAGATMDGLYSILSTWPLRNSYTTYTTMMNPLNYEMESYDVYT